MKDNYKLVIDHTSKLRVTSGIMSHQKAMLTLEEIQSAIVKKHGAAVYKGTGEQTYIPHRVLKDCMISIVQDKAR